MFNRQEFNSLRCDPVDGRVEYQPPLRIGRIGREAAVIEGIGNKPADGRMETACRPESIPPLWVCQASEQYNSL